MRPPRIVQAIARCCLIAVLAMGWGMGGFGLCAAEQEEDDGKRPIRSIADLNGKRLGVIAGTMLDEAANIALDYTSILYFDDSRQEIEALVAGEIDAFIDDEPVARFLAAQDPRLRQLAENMQYDDYAYAIRYEDEDLHARINDVIADLKEDGTIDALIHKWVEGGEEDRVMPEFPPAAADGPALRFGTSPVSAPFSYTGPGGKAIGFDLELMELVARRLDRRLVVTEMEFSLLIPSLLSGQVDIIGACMSITEERRKIVNFTDSYYRGGVAVLVLKDGS